MPQWPFDNQVVDLPETTQIEREPLRLAAGDTLHWIRALSDYPADSGWSITYYLFGVPGFTATFSSTAKGKDHEVTVPQATTSAWFPGRHTFQGVVTNGTETHRVWDGYLVIEPNPALQDGNGDARSWARVALGKLEAAMSGNAGRDVLRSSINGTVIERMTPDQRWAEWNNLKAIVASEDRKALLKAGRATGSKILTRFVNPS